MNIFVNTKNRSLEPEIMDNLSMEGEQLRTALDKIAAINRRLGGNKATIDGIATILKTSRMGEPISVIDLGCGSGDMLRAIADYGRRNKRSFLLTGIDANEFTVNYARKLSAGYPEIEYRCADILDEESLKGRYDIAIATLFMHHFSNDEVVQICSRLLQKVGTGIVINDLHRCRTAYYLFRFISLFLTNPMVRKDGAISVLRGFKRKELNDISKQLENTASRIRWKWAFRFQWIIEKT